MNIYHGQLRKLESERADRIYRSKWSSFYIFIPCYIALGHGLFMIAIDAVGAPHSILMASLLGLVGASISSNRQKILRQDKVIQQLQEQLHEASSHSQQSLPGNDQKAAPEEWRWAEQKILRLYQESIWNRYLLVAWGVFAWAYDTHLKELFAVLW